jgi:PST family polysaccharide transporter
VPYLFVGPVGPLVMALNRPSVFFRLALSEFIFKLPLLLVGVLKYGVPGAVGVRLMTTIFVALCSMWSVSGLIELPIKTQLLTAWRPMLSVVIMALTLKMLSWDFPNRQDYGQLILGLVWIAGIGGAVYVGFLVVLSGTPLRDRNEGRAGFQHSLRRV